MLSQIARKKLVTLLTKPHYNYIEKLNLPKKIEPYLRLGRYDKPIGTLLLHFPCIWGTILGQSTFNLNEILWFSGVFGVGAIVMRAAACIINDMVDKDIDKQVLRTKTRPLATGEITNKQALIALFAHLSMGLGVVSQLSFTPIVAAFSAMPLVIYYPFGKRYIKYPQIILGIILNWGIVVGGLQTGGGIFTSPMFFTLLGSIFQTIISDTIYAHQDKEYDKKLNLYSTTMTLPLNAPLYLTIPFSGCLGLACFFANYHVFTYPALAIFEYLLWKRVGKCNFNDPVSCNHFFIDFKWYQLAVAIIFGFGSYYKYK